MQQNEFDIWVDETFDAMKKLLQEKNARYNGGDDKLESFKHSGMVQKTDPKSALLGMVTKQWTSVVDLIQRKEEVPLEMWDEKLFDLANYMVLMRCLVIDEQDIDLHNSGVFEDPDQLSIRDIDSN